MIRRIHLAVLVVSVLFADGSARGGGPEFVRSDVNADGRTDISDGVLTLEHLFQGSTGLGCQDAADSDDSGALDVTDAVFVFGYLFLGGVAPPAPFLDCGPDPSVDALDCETHPTCAPEPTTPTNVLLVIADDLGVDSAACFAEPGSLPLLPTLTRLCDEGVVFRNAWVNPVCSPTRATLLTGRYGFRTGVGAPGVGIGSDEFTLPMALEAVGRPSACIGKWHLANDSNGGGENPNRMGFSHYSGALGGGVRSYDQWQKTVNGVSGRVQRYATSVAVDDALEWVRGRDEPWFLWLAFNAPHAPFHLPPSDLHDATGLEDSAAAIEADPRPYYEAMLQALDRELGRLLDSLDPEVRARTDVIFLGDNGTPGAVAEPPLGRGRVKDSLYEGGVHAPLVVAGPSVRGPGRSVEALVSGVDVFATVLELAGLDPGSAVPDGVVTDGVSFASLLRDASATTTREFLYTELFGANAAPNRSGVAVRNRTFKLIRKDRGGEELYDLEIDPLEQSNLLDAPLSARTREAYEALVAELESLRG